MLLAVGCGRYWTALQGQDGLGTLQGQDALATLQGQDGLATLQGQDALATLQGQDGLATLQGQDGLGTLQGQDALATLCVTGFVVRVYFFLQGVDRVCEMGYIIIPIGLMKMVVR